MNLTEESGSRVGATTEARDRESSPAAPLRRPRGRAGEDSPPGGRRLLRVPAAHLLVLLALIGLVVRSAVEMGPRDGFDSHWFIGYALAERDSRVFPDSTDHPPLYLAYLLALMTLDAGYERYLECLHENLPHWSCEEGECERVPGGDLASCRRIAHPGFSLQVLLAALSVVPVWLAGYLASGRPAVAHLATLLVVWNPYWLPWALRHTPYTLVVPLLPAFHLLLAYLVFAGTGASVRRRTAAAIAAGLLLGALTLLRPPYEYVLPALAGAAWLWMLRNRARRREIAASSALLLASALLVFAWPALREREENHRSPPRGIYAAEILEGRLEFNEMSARQWAASFVHWSGNYGGRLSARVVGEDAVAALRYGTTEYFPRREREGNLFAELAPEEWLGAALARAFAEWPKHLAVSLPLAWRGMNQLPWVPLGNLLWFAVLFVFVRGTERNRLVLGALSFDSFVVLGICALVSESQARMSLGLLLPLAVGTALAAIRLGDRLSARWARRRGSAAPRNR